MIHSANAPSATSADAVEIPATVAVAQPAHSSLSALCAIARFHTIAADAANLAHQPGLAASAPVSTQDLMQSLSKSELLIPVLIGQRGDLTHKTAQNAIPGNIQETQSQLLSEWQDISAKAEIETGQRRVIEYLLSPIQRAGSESLRAW